MASFPKILTIAGSDSGGGAGIQADLKAFQALGCYGMSAITALTAQNTCGVHGVQNIPRAFVELQMNAVFEDIGADAVKIGMLHSAEIVEVVATTLQRFNVEDIVLDPVMVAKDGSPLLQSNAVQKLRERLLPMSSIVTPNIPEAEFLTNSKIATRSQMENAAKSLLQECARVLVKGGHLANGEECPDFFCTREGACSWIAHPRINTRNTHGTGCTLSAAITAYRGRGFDWQDAVERAREYLQGAIAAGARLGFGNGCGPVHHAWNIRRSWG
jgi:hydroxymethylpyrimidine/phosphomethylpyrimidine kinase